jgi:carbamoyltransferase
LRRGKPVARLIAVDRDDEVPFMMQVFQIREEKRRLIPAVTHVDGSGRLQTVYRETNPRRLIETFAEITGVPLVLNTSFNENEPVVCRPEEALDCFLRTRMEVLVMGILLSVVNLTMPPLAWGLSGVNISC